MNVNIYYGGRGMVDDPTIVVINRIQEVLEELNVTVTRYNLYDEKHDNDTFPVGSRCRWCYICNNSRVGWNGRIYADAS